MRRSNIGVFLGTWVVISAVGACSSPTDSPDASPPDAPTRDASADASSAPIWLDGGAPTAAPFVVNPVCRADGWCWHWPYPVGATLYGAALGPEGAVVVGGGGTILRWPPTHSASLVGAGEADIDNLWAIWYAPSGEAWLAGYSPLKPSPHVWRLDTDGSLSQEEMPDPPEYGFIERVAGRSGEVWAVGTEGPWGSPTGCLAYRRLANTWERLYPPCDSSWPLDVALPESGEVWLAQGTRTLLVLESGGNWRSVATEDHPWGRIWARGNSILVYGADGEFGSVAADGSFTEVGVLPSYYVDAEAGYPMPVCMPAYLLDDGRLAAATNDEEGRVHLFEVGDAGPEEVASMAIGLNIWALLPSPTGYWLFGETGIVFEYATGEIEELSRRPSWSADGLAIWSSDSGTVAVTSGHVGEGPSLLLDWSGSAWEPIAELPMSRSSAGQVWGAPECVFVGNATGLYRWKSDHWETWAGEPFSEAMASGSEVLSIAGVGCDDIYVRSSGHWIRHWDGTRWARLPDYDETLSFMVTGLWAGSDGSLYAAGDGLHRWRDDEWTTELPSDILLVAVWGFPGAVADDLVVGTIDHRSLVKLDGEWSEVGFNGVEPAYFHAIRGWAADEILAVTSRGLLALDDTVWDLEPALWGIGAGGEDGLSLGRDGTVFLFGDWADRPRMAQNVGLRVRK